MLLLASAAAAQRSELNVQVVDTNGAEVGPVSLTFTSPEGEVVEAATKKNGELKIRLKPAEGPWNVLLRMEGFPDQEREFRVSEGRDTSFTVRLLDEAMTIKQEAVDNFNDGIRAIQANDAAGALLLFEKAVELDPTIAAAYRTIAAILHGMGKPAEALEPLDKYIELEELPPEFVGMAFDIFLAAGDPRVEDAKQKAIEAGMGMEIAAGVFSQGVAAVRESDDELAVELFTEAASLNPKLYQAYRNIGTIHFNNQNWGPALEALDRTLELDPRNTEAMRMRFFSHALQGHLEDSIEAGKAWIEVNPTAGNQVLHQANQFFENNEFGNAKLYYQSLVAWDDNQPKAHFQLGMLYIRSADSADARRHLEKLLDMAPDHEDAASAREALGQL
jgi:tetratricopeptide (TPR) repeat protein